MARQDTGRCVGTVGHLTALDFVCHAQRAGRRKLGDGGDKVQVDGDRRRKRVVPRRADDCGVGLRRLQEQVESGN